MRFSSNKIIVTLLMAVALGLARLLSVPAAAESDLGRLPDTVDIVTVRALQGREDVVLIDVREPEEYQAGHIPGITLIPRGQVPSRLAEIPKDKTVILTCRSGNRSSQAKRKDCFVNE
jgi:3-mercaptopyruvate sulfurtransferase SseA